MMIEEKMAAEKEERRNRRKLVMENIQYTFLPPGNQETLDAAITNISESGLCLVTASLLKNGQKITIKNNAQFSEKSATVRWIQQRYDEQLYTVGLEFDEPHPLTDAKDSEDHKRRNIAHTSVQRKSSFYKAKSEHTHDMQKDDFAAQASEMPESSTGDRPSRSELGKDRDRRMGILPLLLILIILLLVTGTGGMILYRSFMQDRDIQPAKELICSIQVGAFKSEANAQVLFQKFKDKGYNVCIDKSDVKDQGIMYKVLIGPFQQIGDTARAAEDIRAKENIDPFVLCK